MMENDDNQDEKRYGDVIIPDADADIDYEGLCTVAGLIGSNFKDLAVDNPVPDTWEDRAKKAWRCYTEEPIVNNVINAWRTLALGDEIILTCADKDVQAEARETARRLKLQKLVKDSITDLLVKGETLSWKDYTPDGNDLAEVFCVNPISVKVKYEHGDLIEAVQHADDFTAPIQLPLEQILHLKWNSPSFNPDFA